MQRWRILSPQNVLVYINNYPMFTRNFMKTFPIRKYGNVTGKGGSISSDIWLLNEKEIWVFRPILYTMFAALTLIAFDNFHTGDEIFGHFTRPVAYTLYENNIPKDVLIPNLEVIENYQHLRNHEEIHKSMNIHK